MSEPSEPPQGPRGPIEDRDWPQRLPAHVVSPGPRPRIHGYDVHGDLAQHYRFAELVLTGLRGDAPDAAEGELFDAVLSFLAPTTMAEPPSHVAVLSRVCGAQTSSLVAASAVTLAEQAAAIVDEHRLLVAWLDAPHGPPPDRFRCRHHDEREAVAAFRSRAERAGLSVALLEHDPTLLAALLAAAHRTGLRSPDQLEALIVTARLPVVLAEGLAHPAGNRRTYPIDLPRFRYAPDTSEPA